MNGRVFARMFHMNARAQRLYEEALELSDEERTKLGWALLASAPDDAWATEMERRITDARAGEAKASPWTR